MDINIVTYNRITYLQKCVNSIIASTKIPKRIRVMDDGSKDGSQRWLVEMWKRGKIEEPILNISNIGTAKCFNKLNLSSSGSFAMANDDMYFHRGWDNAVIDIYKKFPDCGIVSFFNYTRWDIDGGVEKFDKFIKCDRTGLGACFMNVELFKAAGGFKLPQGKKMGWFASNFCYAAAKTNLRRRKVYATLPHYADHMDLPKCSLNDQDLQAEYLEIRKILKHG